MKNCIVLFILFLSVISCKKEVLSEVVQSQDNYESIISSKVWRISSFNSVGYLTSSIEVNGIADFYSDGNLSISNLMNSKKVADRYTVLADSIYFEKFGTENGSYSPDKFSFAWKITKLNELDFWIKRKGYEVKFRSQ